MKPFQHFSELIQMFLLCIEVYVQCHPRTQDMWCSLLSQTVLHQPLKGHWGITEPEWHALALIEPQCTHGEGLQSDCFCDTNVSLNGWVSVTSIWCLVSSVHSISLSSNVKMSWNSARRSKAFSLFSGIQDSNPDRSNFSKSFSLHSSMDSC